MAKEKPTIINISFKTQTLDDKMLLDWLEVKFKEYGKSNYITAAKLLSYSSGEPCLPFVLCVNTKQ